MRVQFYHYYYLIQITTTLQFSNTIIFFSYLNSIEYKENKMN